MKRKVKVEVVTENLGLPGMPRAVEKETITVNGRDCRKLRQGQFRRKRRNRELTEQERLAALYLLWKDEME